MQQALLAKGTQGLCADMTSSVEESAVPPQNLTKQLPHSLQHFTDINCVCSPARSAGYEREPIAPKAPIAYAQASAFV